MHFIHDMHIADHIKHFIFAFIVSSTLINLNGCKATIALDDQNSTNTQDQQTSTNPISRDESPKPSTGYKPSPKPKDKLPKPSTGYKPSPPSKPIAKSDLIIIKENLSTKLNILDNDKYYDKSKLIVDIVQKPKYGKIDKNLIYTPFLNYNGYDEFSYKISDSKGNTSSTKSYITIYKNATQNAPIVQLLKTSITPDELAIVVNDNDPISVKIGSYYAKKRSIPTKNIIHVSIPNNSIAISPEQFDPIIKKVKKTTPKNIQAYALTWIKPFRVGKMSITSAFAFGGYDDAYANTSGGVCSVTKGSIYFGSNSITPFDDFNIRPTMILAGVNEENIKALIDKGVKSDYTYPSATGYFIKTTDTLRSVRSYDFFNIATKRGNSNSVDLDFIYIDNAKNQATNTLKNKNDVLFYFTGLSNVANIDTNSYLPGSIADHLTSYGGNLTATKGKGQMSALRWLEAGATGSYGTVVEPCNYIAKFPMVSKLIPAYFSGSTLIEAYWKSLQWPGEGIFIGEPLAKPWGGSILEYQNGDLIIKTTHLKVGKKYSIIGSNSINGTYKTVLENISSDTYKLNQIIIPQTKYKFYKLVEK